MIFRIDIDAEQESRNTRPIRDRIRFIEDTDWLGALAQSIRYVTKLDPQPTIVQITVAKGDPNAS